MPSIRDATEQLEGAPRFCPIFELSQFHTQHGAEFAAYWRQLSQEDRASHLSHALPHLPESLRSCSIFHAALYPDATKAYLLSDNGEKLLELMRDRGDLECKHLPELPAELFDVVESLHAGARPWNVPLLDPTSVLFAEVKHFRAWTLHVHDLRVCQRALAPAGPLPRAHPLDLYSGGMVGEGHFFKLDPSVSPETRSKIEATGLIAQADVAALLPKRIVGLCNMLMHVAGAYMRCWRPAEGKAPASTPAVQEHPHPAGELNQLERFWHSGAREAFEQFWAELPSDAWRQRQLRGILRAEQQQRLARGGELLLSMRRCLRAAHDPGSDHAALEEEAAGYVAAARRFAREWTRGPNDVLARLVGPDMRMPRVCLQCGVSPEFQRERGVLMRCGHCKLAEYCSPECQERHWERHAARCACWGALADAAEEGADTPWMVQQARAIALAARLRDRSFFPPD
ncbi:unnamed protein product [Pedinophyceae sp. YPF-701]|nr:unnamed protein product [Pedinophyceae sp. YPF-701]